MTFTSSAVITSFANKSYLKHSLSLDLKYCGKIMVYLSASWTLKDLFLGPSQPVNSPRSYKHSQRRRRSQRLATCSLPDDSVEKVSSPSSITDGKVFSISGQNQQSSKLEGNVS